MNPTNRELSIILRLKDMATAAFKRASTAWGRGLTHLKAAAAKAMGALKLLAAAGVAAVSAAMVMGLRSAHKYMLELDRLSKVTGVSVERLGRLVYAMEQEHGTREGLEKGLVRLTDVLGNAGQGMEGVTRQFEILNIEYKDNEGRLITADELMMKLADRFHKGAMTTEELAAAQEILGARMAKDLIPFLKLGREHIEALGDEAERLGVVMSEDTVRAAERFDDEMDKVRVGVRGVWLGIKEGLLPHLEKLAAWFVAEMPKIVDRAKGFGDAIGVWITSIVEAKTTWERFLAVIKFPAVLPEEMGLEEIQKRITEIRAEIAEKDWWHRPLGEIEALTRELNRLIDRKWELVRADQKAAEVSRKAAAEAEARLIWERYLAGETIKFEEEYAKSVKLQRGEILDFFIKFEAEKLKILGEAGKEEINIRKEVFEFGKKLQEKNIEERLKEIEKLSAKERERAEKEAAIRAEKMATTEKDLQIKLIELTEGRFAAEMEATIRHYEQLAEKYPELLELINQVRELDLKRIEEQYRIHRDIISQIMLGAAQAMQTTMSTLFFDAMIGELKTTEDYFKMFAKSMARMLADLLARAIMLKAITAIFGPGHFLLGAMGFAAKGGRIEQGQLRQLPHAQEGAMVARGRAVPIIAHEGEWIGTPARLAQAGIGRDQPPARHYTFNIQAMDAQSFKEYVENNRDALADVMVGIADDNHQLRRW